MARYIAMFVFAAVVILATRRALRRGPGRRPASALGVDEFLLVQWVAPLASEAPELIVACLYAWRLKARDSLGTLLSSKVNQWTLLVGTIPIVFAISAGTIDGLPIDTQQRFELLLTAAQSLFAVSILITLALTHPRARSRCSCCSRCSSSAACCSRPRPTRSSSSCCPAVYVALAVVQFVRHATCLVRTVRDGLVTPFDKLEEADEELPAGPLPRPGSA